MSWVWAAASCRGTSHISAGTRCDDASVTAVVGPPNDEVLLAIASDGAGSASFGAQGAMLVCRTISCHAREHFRRSPDLPTEDFIAEWMDATRDRIAAAASARAAELRDFAATAVIAIVGREELLTAHVGDGGVVVRQDGQWAAASWPEAGEYASTTFFVTDEVGPRLRVSRMASPPDAVAVFTDGIERLVLDFQSKTPHAPFFDRMISPLAHSTSQGRDGGLCDALASYLNSEAVNARTDDDKTLILAARR